MFSIIEKLNDTDLSGVFHCFSGSIKDAERIINLNNFYLGIGGVVTFKNSGLRPLISTTQNSQNPLAHTHA